MHAQRLSDSLRLQMVVTKRMDGRQGAKFNNKPGESPEIRAKESRPSDRAKESRPSDRANESRPTDRANESRPSDRSGSAGSASQNFQSVDSGLTEISERLRIGDTIGGSYSILSLLGKGGMGQVFAVEHLMLRQRYALKILTNDSPNNIGWRRFQTEARTIAKLDHPNIIKVHNLGIHDEKLPYYVMELLEGESLSQLVRREGALEPSDVIELFLPICEGLAYAHANGIVHRDIKPSNIMLISKNRKIVPMLVDFGLVKLVGNALSPSQQLTNTGEVFGSPLYMSPEQSVGRHINERSDIYSLGCTMFETLTGVPPFVGENVVQTILKHQNEDPPTLKQASMGLEFSDEWEALIIRVLAKEASDRYQTMDELRHDLQAIKDGKTLSRKYATTGEGDLFSDDEEIEKEKVVAKSHIMIIGSVVLLAVLGIVGAGGYMMWRQQKAPVTTSTTVNGLNYGGVQTEQAPRTTGAFDKQLEDVSIPFVQNGGLPINGFKVYKFPADYSLGTLYVAYEDPTKAKDTFEARGEVKIPIGGKVTFEAGSECGVHPKIFRKFLPSDLLSLQLYGGATDTDDTLNYLDHLTELVILNLDGTDVTAKGLKAVGQMPNLTSLSLKHTDKLNGSDVAKLTNLKKLRSIIFSQDKDVMPLLQALKNSSTITSLAIDQTNPGAEGIKLIATMSNLESVSLNNCNLTDEDLVPLKNLASLNRIFLRGDKLSPKFIDMWKVTSSISWMEISTPKWSEADLNRFKAIMDKRLRIRDEQKLEF